VTHCASIAAALTTVKAAFEEVQDGSVEEEKTKIQGDFGWNFFAFDRQQSCLPKA
jgi:hypothetical protein